MDRLVGHLTTSHTNNGMADTSHEAMSTNEAGPSHEAMSTNKGTGS